MVFLFSFFFCRVDLLHIGEFAIRYGRETSALELESARYGRLNELYRAGVTITRACGHGSRLQSQQEKTVGSKEYFSCISFLFPPSGTRREKQNGRVCVCVSVDTRSAYKKGATRWSPFHHKAPRTESTSPRLHLLDSCYSLF
jgi:hypothetical protein